MTKYTTAGLHAKVGNALSEFFRKDACLLDLRVNERSITHKLAEYLQREFGDCDGLKVDCEYNKHGIAVKRLNVDLVRVELECTETHCAKAPMVYPDIIVHERGCDSNNLLVIEVKKSNALIASNAICDQAKLREFTKPKPEGEYGYKLGLFLEFCVGNQRMKHAECFENGSENEGCSYCNRLSAIPDCGSQH